MRKRIIEKLKSNKGISLTELLVTLIFCLMTFALVCSAMQASSRELKRETTVSESKILCSTLTIAIQDKLRYSYNIDGTSLDNLTFTYDKNKDERFNKAQFVNKNGKIVISVAGGSNEQMIALAPDSAYTQGIKAELTELTFSAAGAAGSGSSNNAVFKGKVRVMDAAGNELSSQSFAVEALNSDIKAF